MSGLHDVLRYLLDRVPHSTQEHHDQVADLIDQDEHGQASAAAELPDGDKPEEGVH